MMRPVKEKRGSMNKIDGAVALIMAVARAMANEPPEPEPNIRTL